MMSQLYFKNVTNNNGHQYQEFSKAIGIRSNGDERMYSIQGHSIKEDADNFYVTISKLNNDLLTKQSLILNRVGLQRILEGSNVLVLNEKQIKNLPGIPEENKTLQPVKEKKILRTTSATGSKRGKKIIIKRTSSKAKKTTGSKVKKTTGSKAKKTTAKKAMIK